MLKKKYFQIFFYIFLGICISQFLSLGYAELPLNMKWFLSDIYISFLNLLDFTDNEIITNLELNEKLIECKDIEGFKKSWSINE